MAFGVMCRRMTGFFFFLWMSLSGRGGCGCRLLIRVLCENRRRLCMAFIKYSYMLPLLAVF